MRTILLAILLLAPHLAVANKISVGERDIRIPTPADFAPVTPGMGELYEMQALFVAPGNQEFITFVSEQIVPQLLQGEIPVLDRRFSVQTATSMLRAELSTDDFHDLKTVLKAENNEIVRRVAEQVPGLMDQLNADFDRYYQIDPALSMSQLIPLPVHHDGLRSMAYSAFTQYRMNDEDGEPFDFIVTVTATFVHVNGRVLFLYAYGSEDDLDWTREAAKAWTADIIAANPQAARAGMSATRRGAGFDWTRIIAVGVLGGIVMLVAGLLKRR